MLYFQVIYFMQFNFKSFTIHCHLHIIKLVYVYVIFTLLIWAIYCDCIYLFVYFVCVCGLRTLKYLINNKNPKKCLCGLLDLIWALDLELGNIPYAKGLGQCQHFWNQVIVIWAFIWCKYWDPLEFICYMVLMQMLLWTCV